MAKNLQIIVVVALALFALIILAPAEIVESYEKTVIDDILFFIVAGLPIAVIVAIFIFIMGGEKPRHKD